MDIRAPFMVPITAVATKRGMITDAPPIVRSAKVCFHITLVDVISPCFVCMLSCLMLYVYHFQDYIVRSWLVNWLVVFNVPSKTRSFRDGTTIYCPLRRTCNSVFTPSLPGIKPPVVAWQSITQSLRHASSTTLFDINAFQGCDVYYARVFMLILRHIYRPDDKCIVYEF